MKTPNNTNRDPGPVPDYKPTECVHCGQKFSTLSQVPIIGEPASAGFQRFCNGLMQHLMKQHPEAAQAAVFEAAALSGWMYLRNFRSYDPEMIRQMDETRHNLHSRTRLISITDEKITQKVRELAGLLPGNEAPSGYTAMISVDAAIELFHEFRDLYEERGLHPPTQPGPKLVV